MNEPTGKHREKGMSLEASEPSVLSANSSSHLLVIGIDRYAHLPPLYNAVKDAQEIAGILLEDYQFDRSLSHFLLNEQASMSNILYHLEGLADRVGPGDNVLIYFSGHGEYREKIDEGFWIPVDGHPDNLGSFLSFGFLMKYIKAISSLHTFIIADACYAGNMFVSRSRQPVLDQLGSIPSRWLLTAGRNEVVSDGRPGDNSPFADALLWMLKQKQTLRVSELCLHVVEAVRRNANQLPRGAALQGAGDKGGEFIFYPKDYTPSQPMLKTQMSNTGSGFLPPEKRKAKEVELEEVLRAVDQQQHAGLIRQTELTVRRLNYLREQLAISTDANQRFTLELQIEQYEQELAAAKQKLLEK